MEVHCEEIQIAKTSAKAVGPGMEINSTIPQHFHILSRLALWYIGTRVQILRKEEHEVLVEKCSVRYILPNIGHRLRVVHYLETFASVDTDLLLPFFLFFDSLMCLRADAVA